MQAKNSHPWPFFKINVHLPLDLADSIDFILRIRESIESCISEAAGEGDDFLARNTPSAPKQDT